MIGTREGNLAALYLIHEFLEQHHDISPFQRSTLLFYRGLGEQQEERRSEAGVSFRASLDSYPLPRNDIFTRTVQKYLHQLGE
jgi:hypothetical protein